MRPILLERMWELKRDVDRRSLEPHGPDVWLCGAVQYYLSELIAAKIPTEYWELSIDALSDVRPESTLDIARKYIVALDRAVRRSLGIMLIGENGRGKTAIQCAIGKAAVAKGIRVQYFTAQQYVEAVKARESELLAEYESGQLLLVDELDAVYIAHNSVFVPKMIEEFLRRMFSRGAALVICTNTGPEHLGALFGTSTMSAITGHLKLLPLFGGSDFRDTQQSDWDRQLERDVDYFHPHIVELATALRAHEIAEESEMLYDWQKAT